MTAAAPPCLTVDLDALAHNFHVLRAAAGPAEVHPVVKADAYGLGAVPVARRLMAEGARTFFVARLAGGEVLRQALGPEAVIYVLDGCLAGHAPRLRAADLRPVLNDPRQLAAWRDAGGGPCGLHIDTGMNRLGLRPEEAPGPFAGLQLVMSHMACADEPARSMNRRQRDAFAAVAARYPGAVRSFANSGGVFLGPDYAFDAVRPGISLYGGGPEGRPDPRLRAVAAFEAEVLTVRDVPAGETVGYSAGWRADRAVRAAIVGVGYADGVLRANCPRGQVAIGGQRRPMLGRVSMDLLAVDVTGLAVGPGDRAQLFGPDLPVDEAAAAAGTVAYEMLTAVTARVPRRYLGEV